MKTMKKITALFLSLILAMSLAACGGGNKDAGSPAQEAPDLNQYVEDFLASMGEDNQPALMDVEGDVLEQTYPGLSALETRQLVAKTPMITAVAFEFVLAELANEADVQAAVDILQARIDYQIESGAFYPATAEAWENAQIITHGNVVALICAGEEQERAAEAFDALFA